MESSSAFTREFDTARDLFDAFQDVAHEMKFSLKILRSDYKKKRISISCDCAGSYSPVASIRKTSTKKTGCKFRLLGKQNSEGEWKMVSCHGEHNHGLYDDVDMHTTVRRFTEEQREERLRLERAGVKPKAQLAVLRQQYEGFTAVQRDLYNKKQKARRQFFNGRSPLQALLDVVKANNYRFEYQRDGGGHISHLMLANPKSLKLARAFHNVILLDCTYKTNKYSLPLLVCTGMTPFSKSLLCCTAFMAAEEVADYVWALRSIKKLFSGVDDPQVIVSDNEKALLKAGQVVFPGATQLLCRWHINKNVLARSKKVFQDEDKWTSMMKARTTVCSASSEQEFSSRWTEFCSEFGQYPDLIAYLDATWLTHKEKFVDAWISKSLHLGCSTTSRVESTHSFLKRFLSSSVGDLLTVFREFDLAIEHQLHELRKIAADDRVKRPAFCSEAVFSKVVNRVSSAALDAVHESLSASAEPKCACKIKVIMGFPCAHDVRDRISRNEVLEVSDFHKHWHLEQFVLNVSISVPPSESTSLDGIIPVVMERFANAPVHERAAIYGQLADTAAYGPTFAFKDPRPAKTKGRPTGASNKSRASTARDHSAFGYVEGSSRLKNKCGLCRSFDHNARTCPQKTS